METESTNTNPKQLVVEGKKVKKSITEIKKELGLDQYTVVHQPIKVQEEELRYAEWRNRTDVFDALDDSSLTAEMIGLFRNGKKEY